MIATLSTIQKQNFDAALLSRGLNRGKLSKLLYDQMLKNGFQYKSPACIRGILNNWVNGKGRLSGSMCHYIETILCEKLTVILTNPTLSEKTKIIAELNDFFLQYSVEQLTVIKEGLFLISNYKPEVIDEFI